jgi:hypothetical protein
MRLNNREWAILCWLSLGVAFALTRRDVRSGVRDLARTARQAQILLPVLIMLAYVSVLVRIGWRIGLWNVNLIKGTVVWFIVSGVVLLMNSAEAGRERRFFRRTALRTLEATVFVEFVTNLFVLSLPAELGLQPTVALLVAVSVVGGGEKRYHAAKRFVDALLAVVALGLAGFSMVQLVRQWDELNKSASLLEFVLPVWLTLGLLPFIYLIALYGGYRSSFKRIDSMVKNHATRRRAKLALIMIMHGRVRNLSAFTGDCAEKIASTASLSEARDVIKKCRASRREQEAAIEEEQARLKRGAGLMGTDADGRQLDQREFKETTQALRWLATCQMGWYNNPGNKYRADLFEILTDSFSWQGLPSEYGITLYVAKDGQSWWAWRRTITGWCFAIGAAGPPPDQWEFDGPEPPGGFPGEDESWGDGPSSPASTRNW